MREEGHRGRGKEEEGLSWKGVDRECEDPERTG